MADCKICGKIDKSKPGHWDNWDCMGCVVEQIRNTDGTLTPTEKKIEYRKRTNK
jgi:hypothetical protein